MTSKAYIFVEGLDMEPVICGVFALDVSTGTGRFKYGQSYLGRADAFAIDPLHLPLSTETFSCTLNKGIFGVLGDAGADAWGRKLILQLRKTKPGNELEFLLAGSSMGVGALSFSLSQTKAKAKASRNTIDDLDTLLQGKNAILNSEQVSEEVKKAFEYGSSMGGARPKSVLQHQGDEFIIKFNRSDDLFNHARVEHGTMKMLAELSAVEVAETQVLAGPDELLLVKRFDRAGELVTRHFISANSLLLEGAVSSASIHTWYSYGQLAELLRRYSDVATDAVQLYKRMVFNVFIGNTDDHARNHAMTFDFLSRTWALSPAYDVLPVSNSRQHSLGIGDDGRIGSIDNLLSQARRFGLRPRSAQRIVDEVRELVFAWPSYMRNAGVKEGDLERLKGVIPKQ